MPKKGVSNNPNGRPAGSKNGKTEAWEALAESIVGIHAERFNAIMADLALSDDPEEKEMFLSHYSKILKFFKPQMQATQHSGDATAPIIIQIPKEI